MQEQHPKVPAEAACPNENAVAEFLDFEANLGAERRAALGSHVNQCDRCRQLVAVMRTQQSAGQAIDQRRLAYGSDPTEAGVSRAEPGGQLVPGALLGRYRIEAVLGQGGMGVVYAAHDPELDRRVAVKVIRPGLGEHREHVAARLAREARAMAQITHPNVVTVHDVGESAGCVFVAMELAPGGTLRQWLAAEPRSWRAVLEMFRGAGEGLAAAHEAKLVHRDFKPDNVLLDERERVRVTDFGLVRALEEVWTGAEAQPGERSSVLAGGLPLALTRTGLMLGTPAYMSPEQYDHLPIDERSDQFSYCVALWEAIYREPPFSGQTLPELAEAVVAGRVRPAPRRPRVPRWLRRALERGLSRLPEERFPSMVALLEAIRPRRSRVAIAIAAATTMTLLGTGTLALAAVFGAGEVDRAQSPCEGGEAKLQAVWSDARKLELRGKLVATSTPETETRWQLVDHALGRYRSAWLSMYRDTCQARVRGDQSAEVLDLRTHCLETRLTDLQQVVGLLDTTDPVVVENATKTVEDLPPVERCSTVEVMEARTPVPADPVQRTQIEALRREVARADGLTRAGRFSESRALLDQLLQRAEALGYRPAIADVLYQLGRLEEQGATIAQAEATLSRAALMAASSRYDQLAAEAWTLLIIIAAQDKGDLIKAAEYGAHARAALDRLGGNARLESRYERYMARLDIRRSEPEKALARYMTASRLAEKIGDAAIRLSALDGIAEVYGEQGKLEEALRLNLEVLAGRVALFGADHPNTAVSRNNVANSLADLGRHQEALEQMEKVLATHERASGPEHVKSATSHLNIATCLRNLGRFQEALDRHQRALALFRRKLGPEHELIARSHQGIGMVYFELGREKEALPHLRRALAILRKTVGEEYLETVNVHTNLAETLRALGRHREALWHDKRALATGTKVAGEESAYAAHALLGLGLDLCGLKRWRKARRPLERAIALFEKTGANPVAAAAARFELARALWPSRRERSRARRLAEKASAELAAAPAGPDTREYRAKVQSWMRAHSRSR